MPELRYSEAIDRAVVEAMQRDERIIVLGEDVPMIRAPAFARFGPKRILATPISESAFVGAAAGAAMAGLRPVVEVMEVDFIAVAMDAVLNQIAKLESFSGGDWRCPLVLRTTCGAGYGDAGQHGQVLWGMLGGIPGLVVVAPSTPADGYGLMRAALEHDGPVVFLEHKLLSEQWLEYLGRGGRDSVEFDVPDAGARGPVEPDAPAIPFGSAAVRREGSDVTIASLAVGVHRALEAARALQLEGTSCQVIDLRSVRPLDVETVAASVERTGRLVVVDEDYREFGLAGELAAAMLERGLEPAFARVCVEDTLPYARALEDAALPNVDRIRRAVVSLL